MFLNHICLPMPLKILFCTPNLAISTSLNCWSVLYWIVRRESMLLFRHWQEELPWAHSAEQGTMRSTTIRGINDNCEALNFYLGNSVVRFCVSFIELINLWEIHNKYEKIFYLFTTLKMYSSHQECTRSSEVSCPEMLSWIFKILLFLYQDQYFRFLFPTQGSAHQVIQPHSLFRYYLLTLKFLTPHKWKWKYLLSVSL